MRLTSFSNFIIIWSIQQWGYWTTGSKTVEDGKRIERVKRINKIKAQENGDQKVYPGKLEKNFFYCLPYLKFLLWCAELHCKFIMFISLSLDLWKI